MKTHRPVLFCAAVVLLSAGRAAGDVPYGGFLPFVGITLTDEYKNGDFYGDFFIADRETSIYGTQISGSGSPYYDLALLDTGAATHILTAAASGSSGFDIDGNGFDGKYTQDIGGATGTITTSINDPLAIFAAGLGDGSSDGTTLTMNTGVMRGQSSVATLSAPSSFKLPNILGLPMAAQHQVVIHNDDPQIFTHQGRTVRTPQIEFTDLGSTDHNILRRSPIKITPGLSFVTGPVYQQNIDIFSGDPFHENPMSPTVIENAGLMIDVDMERGGESIDDKEFLLDTGADFTVVSEQTAARLGFDPILDTPDFVLQVEGSGGVAGEVPGFIVDSLSLDTVGGTFELTNVPIAVLDVTNPTDPGNIVDGILGMHVFTGRNIAIDTTPSIGQGGVGPSLYISDPVTSSRTWDAPTASADWITPSSWADPGVPTELWDVTVSPRGTTSQTAVVSADSTVFRAVVAGSGAAQMTVDVQSGTTLTVFADVELRTGAVLNLDGGTLDAQFVQIEGGSLTGDGELMLGSGPVYGSVRNESGTVAPGDPMGTRWGEIRINGDYSQGADGAFEVEIGRTIVGSQFDQIETIRYVFLDGQLDVEFLPGYQPEFGETYTLVRAGSELFGTFDTVTLPGGIIWDLQYNTKTVDLHVISTIPGDFDGDMNVDGDDLVAWRAGFGAPGFDLAGLMDWQRYYGTGGLPLQAVPEPASAGLLAVTLLAILSAPRRPFPRNR